MKTKRLAARLFLIATLAASFAGGYAWRAASIGSPNQTLTVSSAAALDAPPAGEEPGATPKTKPAPPQADPLALRRTPLVTATARVAPAVVAVSAERPAYVPFPGLFDDFFGNPQVYEKIRTKTPYLGSGISIDNQGHIVTNYHVVVGAERLFVTLADNEEYEAKLIAEDQINDIAILKVDGAGKLHPAPLGDSDSVLLGESVLAVGNPYGSVLEDPSPTITAGVVSAPATATSAPTATPPSGSTRG